MNTTYNIPKLPLEFEQTFNTPDIINTLIQARTALAELKGISKIMPNEKILVQTLSLQEATKSNEIENIVTTQDDLFSSDVQAKKYTSQQAKEVYNYANALINGYHFVRENKFLPNREIIKVFATIEEVDSGFRTVPVYLKDNQGNIIYTPPEIHNDIVNMMGNLEIFINDTTKSNLDPLIKMAIIHHQFESIHPFHDGNGRSGRILNILYLVLQGVLEYPTLYLSRYINTHKQDYYNLLQAVRENPDYWTDWIIFILQGVQETAIETINLIKDIRDLMLDTKNKIRNEKPHMYSQDLINIIFSYPYTKIKYVKKDLNIVRQTASIYLDTLVKMGVLEKVKIRRENYYLNYNLIYVLKGQSAAVKV